MKNNELNLKAFDLEMYDGSPDTSDIFSRLLNDNINLRCGGYSFTIDLDIYNVMKLSADSDTMYSAYIAKELNLSEDYVELIKYIICSEDLADYGTSPRGSWLESKGIELLKLLTELKIKMDENEKT